MSTLPAKSFFHRVVFIQFFVALSWALTAVVFPILLKERFQSEQTVSTLYTIFNTISLLTLFVSVPLIKRLHQRRSFDLSILLMPPLLIAIAFSLNKWELIVIYALYTLFNNLYVFNVNLYLPRLQKPENLMASQGKLGAIYNAAWVMGPILGGLLAKRFTGQSVFFFSAVAAAVAFLALPYAGLPRAPVGNGLNNPLREAKVFFSNRFRAQAFINGLGINFIYGGWFLIPLLLQKLGANLTTIGIITGLVGLPWVFLEIPVGKIADKRVSSRTLFVLGYGVLAFTMLLMGFSQSLWLFTAFYALAVIGSCFIEQTNLPYFTRGLSSSERGLIGIFLIKVPLGAIISPLLATFLLTYFSLGQVISIFGILTGLFVLNALFLPHPFQSVIPAPPRSVIPAKGLPST